MNTLQDRIRGSLIGGAIGDALGYPVEFIYSFEGIQARYGERGITRLDTKQHWLDETEQAGKAVVSDDTQMTLFTANGLLMGLNTSMPASVLYPMVNGGIGVIVAIVSCTFFRERITAQKLLAILTGLGAIVLLNL